MDIGSLVAKYLPIKDQSKLLTDLLVENRFEELYDILCTIRVDDEALASVSDQIFEKAKGIIASKLNQSDEDGCDKEELKLIAHVSTKVPAVLLKLIIWITDELVSYTSSNCKQLFPGEYLEKVFSEMFDTQVIVPPPQVFNIEVLFDFLEFAFLLNHRSEVAHESLDKILVTLLACNIEHIATSCSRLMRWKIYQIADKCSVNENFDFLIWNAARFLYRPNLPQWKTRNGFLFLLRFLMTKKISQSLLKFMQSDDYWIYLQYGLTHDVHEYRKFSLSILKLTLQNLPKSSSFTTTFLACSPESWNSAITSWKKFTTLYEIVGIDTALNQVEAAASDILDLFENENIHPSWGLIILSTGLKADMESVRKLTLKLMFKVKDKSVFQYNLSGLKESFLPFAMQAQHFNVVDNSCPYGEMLSCFVESLVIDSNSIIRGTQNGLVQAKIMITTLLELICEQKASFDPARIYVSLGILNALKAKKLRILDSSHLSLIARLFLVRNEEEVFDTTIQTINLKLLLYTNVPVLEWIEAIASQIKYSSGSYKFFNPLLENFRDFAIAYYSKEIANTELCQFNTDDSVFKVLAYLLFEHQPSEIDQEFLLELTGTRETVSEFTNSYTELLSNLVSNFDDADFDGTFRIVELPIFNAQTWNSVKLEPLYNSLRKNFNGGKFKFFVHVYEKTVMHCVDLLPLSFKEILDFYDIIKTHVEEDKKQSFKYKDAIYGDFFVFVLHYLKTNALVRLGDYKKGDELFDLLSLMKKNITADNGNYHGSLAIVNVCEHILDTYIVPKLQSFEDEEDDDTGVVTEISYMMSIIWDSISGERLVLKQKELHLALINTWYHPMMLFFATGEFCEQLEHATILWEYGEQIISKSHSRRTFLPLLSKKLDFFMRNFSDKMTNPDVDYWWLIELMIAVFTHTQTNTNVFRLKPVIGKLFDKKLGVYLGSNTGLYHHVYGDEEISTRVNIISTMLNASDDFRDQFMMITMIDHPNVLKAQKRADGPEEIERLLTWQLMLLTIKTLEAEVLSSYVKKNIIPSLIDESSPLVRVYSEWFIAYDLAQTVTNESATENEDSIFDFLQDNSKPVLAVSAERICFITLKALSDKNQEKRFMNRFLAHLLPNCTSNKPLIRHFSNSLMLSFWPNFQDKVHDTTLNGILENLYKNAQSIQVHGQYRAGDANVWDLRKDLNLTSIFGGVLLKISGHDVPYISEDIFEKFLTSRNLFPIGRDEKNMWLAKSSNCTGSTASLPASQKNSFLQTKSGAWENVIDIDNQKSSENIKRSELIVVASLVDKPPNLGGICRLCDVLGVGLLTVHDIRVKNHSQFKAVSVTADRWMPIEEVTIDGLIGFMKEKKKEGYTLIGLEQTDKSVKLDNRYKFPSKSLILLGTEAEGIPGHLLSELDLCLEIKQSGVIRSMNIQTATAVIVHSYSVQHDV